MRALGAVAVAAAAEHAQQAGRIQFAGGAQHVFQAVGRVRVIHDDAETARIRHGFEAAGNGRQTAPVRCAMVSLSMPSFRQAPMAASALPT